MNSVKLQDIKSINRNLWHLYKPITSYHNEKLGKQCHLEMHQNNKIFRNKFNQEVKDAKIYKTVMKKLKKTHMNRYHIHRLEESILLKCTTQISLQIQ